MNSKDDKDKPTNKQLLEYAQIGIDKSKEAFEEKARKEHEEYLIASLKGIKPSTEKVPDSIINEIKNKQTEGQAKLQMLSSKDPSPYSGKGAKVSTDKVDEKVLKDIEAAAAKHKKLNKKVNDKIEHSSIHSILKK